MTTEQNPNPSTLGGDPIFVETPTDGPTVDERLETTEATALAAQDAALAALEAAGGKPVRYAVYDTTYLRYAPGVFDKKPTTAAAKKLVGHDGFEVHEV